MKKLKYILMVGLLSLLAVSCSSKPSNKGDYYEPGGNQQQNGEKFEGALGDNNIIIPEGHKIIYTVEYELRIEEEIASTIKVINQEVYTLNGYIQTSNDSLSYATYVYKVPTENLNTFLNTSKLPSFLSISRYSFLRISACSILSIHLNFSKTICLWYFTPSISYCLFLIYTFFKLSNL